jgi:hypothetical protein
MTVDQAAETYQSVITKWRKLHGQELQFYRKWVSG